MSRRWLDGLLTMLTLLLGSFAGAQSAHAFDFRVTDTNDNTVRDGSCSLREALNAANADSYSADCGGTGQRSDRIILYPGTTYVINSTLLVKPRNPDSTIHIESPILEKGPATIKAAPFSTAGAFRGIQVETGNTVGYPYANLELFNLSLQGFGAGALYAGPDTYASVRHVEIANNTMYVGGGQSPGVIVGTYAHFWCDRCNLRDNTNGIKGGGIYVYTDGLAELWNSNISGNRVSQYGGGVHAQGNFICHSTTITGNRADIRGGGISKAGGYVSLSGCTVVQNVAGECTNYCP